MKILLNIITMLNVLHAISDAPGRDLFTSIATDVHSFRLTHKQYYDRLSRLTKLDLIKRKKEKYVLTTFGKVIYQLYLLLGEAINDRFVLEPLEQLKPEEKEVESLLIATVEN
jgi:hypothetical protein